MVQNIAIYTLTSDLHDEEAINVSTHEFLSGLDIDYDYCGSCYDDFGSHALDLIFVRTGGTEGLFLKLLPFLRSRSSRPFRLLTSGKSNSLAASMEILSFLRQQGMKGEILHGSASYISERAKVLAQAEVARHQLQGMRLGIVGQPSDWLISSNVDRDLVQQHLGIELVDIKLPLMDDVAKAPSAKAGALLIYDHLSSLVRQHRLDGFTLRCFDLLTAVHNTGCLALARLNSEGIIAGCEGDVPALLSMAIVKAITGVSGFQANPARINPQTGELLFAHCTIPLNMVESYELDTHFESGIGIGIRGFMKPGPITVFKIAPDLSRSFVAEGNLLRNQSEPDLCRTQQVLLLKNPHCISYFLNNPIGNHHIIVSGHHKAAIDALLQTMEQAAS